MEIEWEYMDAGIPGEGDKRYWIYSYSPRNAETGNHCGGCFIIKDMHKPQYFISAMSWGKPDLGPFDNLKDAKAAAETMIRLNAYPEGWVEG